MGKIIQDNQKVVCNRCNNDDLQRYGHDKGKQRYYCKNCHYEGIVGTQFRLVSLDEKTTIEKVIKKQAMNKPKIGISLSEFRNRHDLNHIVGGVLSKLNGDTLYEKDDIVKLCGLRPGYPGLTATLEENKEFNKYRGRVASKTYWGAPHIIENLKQEGLLT